MGTPAQIGKAEYKAALENCRAANRELRQTLKRIMREGHSSLIQALVGQASLSLGDSDEALNRLAEIGQRSKDLK